MKDARTRRWALAALAKAGAAFPASGFTAAAIDAVGGDPSARGWLQPLNALAGGATGDGVANDATPLQAMISGGKIVNLAGRTYRINSSLTSGDNDLTIIGPGTILYPRSVPAVIFNPTWAAATNVTAIATEVYVASIGEPVSKLTVISAAGLSVRDVVLVRSSDDATNDGSVQAKSGELAQILGISGNTIWLSCLLKSKFTTSIVLQPLPKKKLRIIGFPKFICYDDIDAPGTARSGAVIELRGADDPIIEADFEKAPSRALFGFTVWRGDIKVKASRLKDLNSDNAYGYGVSLAGASRYTKVAVDAQYVRHAFTTNIWPASQPWHYGEQRELTITGKAVNTTAAAWDNHPGAFDLHYVNIEHHQSIVDGDAQSGTAYAFQDRSIGTVVDGMICTGISGGAYCISPIDPGYNYDTIINDYTCLSTAAEVASNGQATFLNASGGAGINRQTIIVNNMYAKRRILSQSVNVRLRFNNCTFDDAGSLRLFGPTLLKGCTRISASGSNESLGLNRTGTTYTIIDMHFIGPYFGSSYVAGRAGSGSTVTLRTAGITSDGQAGHTFLGTGDGLTTVTQQSAVLSTGV